MKIIDNKNINEVRKEIKKIKKENKEEKVMVRAQDEYFNRKILEMKDVDVLVSPEIHSRKDFLKQRDSGLNEYMCKLASKNNIIIGIDIERIKRMEKKEKAKIISRIKQNISLCKKTNTIMTFVSERKYFKQEIISFFIVLKGSTEQAKKAADSYFALNL